ncbi:hypothetical protein [Allokutzneria oryzae]|uniref:ATP-binding protein n=1 Tax=Allokutzneria oryzae TaxID=1378989 RepID=A0ABV6A518_9PSEU
MCEHHHYTDEHLVEWHCRRVPAEGTPLAEIGLWIGELLAGWAPATVFDVQLLACELVGHVLTHAGGAGEIALTEPVPGVARVEVTALAHPAKVVMPCAHEDTACTAARAMVTSLTSGHGTTFSARGPAVWGEVISVATR